MSDRKRIDVSLDAYEQLTADAQRRGLMVRELIDQLARDLPTRHAPAPTTAADEARTNRLAEQARQIGDVVVRFDRLLERQVEDIPIALTAGFETIKDTIRKTGGTGHLRDLIMSYEAGHAAQFESIRHDQDIARKEHAQKLDGTHAGLATQIRALGGALAALRAWHTSRRRVAMVSSLGTIVCIVSLGLMFADTPPTRWYAVRLTGNTRPAQAAYTLVGDGRATGALMAKTRALLKDPRFRAAYLRCVTHARQVKAPFSCRLTVPPIAMVDG